MKACAGGDIDIEIGMVHAMKTPEDRLVMEGPMLRVDYQIQSDDGEDGIERGWFFEPVKQAPTSLFGKQSEANGAGWQRQAHKQRINNGNTDIRKPAGAAAHRVRTAGNYDFAQRQQ